MSENSSSVDWKTIIVSALSTFIVTAAASFAFYYYTLEKPKLRYENFPISTFISNQNRISIINVKIENSGNKEVDDVVALFKFSGNTVVKEIATNLSTSPIKYSLLKDSLMNTVKCDLPTLNSGESYNFSFLLNSTSDTLKISDLEVQLRGKGANGIEKSKVDVSNEISYVTISSMVAVVISLLAFSLGNFTSLLQTKKSRQQSILIKEETDRLQEKLDKILNKNTDKP